MGCRATFGSAAGSLEVDFVRSMIHQPFKSDDKWERDPVWKLLGHASPVRVGLRFADDTVRMARLAGQSRSSWWAHFWAPMPLAGLAVASVVLVISVGLWMDPAFELDSPGVLFDAKLAAVIQDIAESETLIAAVDQLDDFSDTELVSLIGF